MKSIAAKAGVSVMTVSRALRNHPEISPQTREKVLKIAASIGYIKNPLISALMTQRARNRDTSDAPIIALIHCLPFEQEIVGNMLTFRLAAIEQAHKLGYRLEEFHLQEPGLSQKRLFSILANRGIHGVIFEHHWSAGNRISADLSRFACVAIGHTISEPIIHRIDSDHNEEALMAMRRLHEYGYQRVCFANLESTEEIVIHKRRAAFLHFQLYLPPANRIPPLFGARTAKELAEKTCQHIARYRPDVIASNNPRLPGLLEKQGIRIPDDIAFAHLGWNEAFPTHAGINPNWRQKAISAVNVVVNQINRNEFGAPPDPLTISVASEWIDGPSVPIIARKKFQPLEPETLPIPETS